MDGKETILPLSQAEKDAVARSVETALAEPGAPIGLMLREQMLTIKILPPPRTEDTGTEPFLPPYGNSVDYDYLE